jgi:hypothetical protein
MDVYLKIYVKGQSAPLSFKAPKVKNKVGYMENRLERYFKKRLNINCAFISGRENGAEVINKRVL